MFRKYWQPYPFNMTTNWMHGKQSHTRIWGTASTFRHIPVNVLRRHFYWAAFAMQTILSINLQGGLSRFVIILDILIDFCRAKSLFRGCKMFPRYITASFFVTWLNFQMRGLVVIMVSTTSGQVCEEVKCEDAIMFGVNNFSVFWFWLGCFRVFLLVSKRPWFFTFCNHLC